MSGGGSKSKSKQQSQQTSESESGTKYNADFMKQALEFAKPKSYERSPENFDSAAYLKAHPELASTDYNKAPMNTDTGLYQHWTNIGQYDPSGKYQFTPKADVTGGPTYDPRYERGTYTPGAYTPGAYTGAQYTSVAPEGFAKLESSLYGTQSSKLKQAYDQSLAQQREELAQSGALNSPSQYLEGSARSSLDRSYISNLQQAARDAFTSRLGAEVAEAGRKTDFAVGQASKLTDWFTGQGAARTAYDVGQGTARTAFDTGEATRQTGFNEQTATQLLDLWMKKLGIAIEAGRYSKGEGQGTSSGQSNAMSGQGSIFWG